jgi:hypothetical protein
MKLAHTTLIASFFFVATAILVPVSATAGGHDCLTQTVAKQAAALQVDFDLKVAIDATRTGKYLRDEVDKLGKSVKAEEDVWSVYTDQCLIQDMMAREIGLLMKRAKLYVAHEDELRQFEVQVVLGRYERAAAEINEAWQKGEIRGDFAAQVISAMSAKVFEYLESLGVVDVRARLQEAIQTLIERGNQAIDRAVAQQQFFVKLYTIRAETALAVLLARAAAGTASVEDLERIWACYSALDRLEKFTTPYEC